MCPCHLGLCVGVAFLVLNVDANVTIRKDPRLFEGDKCNQLVGFGL